ncbi:MAG: lipopolysaccharide heptosyltransferase II [Pseudomonadales bacterium]
MRSSTPREHAPRVLIVAPAWVGDMVMAQVLVPILKARDPEPEVVMIAPQATAPLARRMPGVASVQVLDIAHGELGVRRRLRVARSLREQRFDQAIVLPNSHKSAWIPWLARIPLRTGWLGEHRFGVLNDWRRLVPATLPRMVDRFAALGTARSVSPPVTPTPRLAPDGNAQRALLDRLALDTGVQGPVVLCPGAEYGPAKRWPAHHFATVARRCLERGEAVWLLGSPKDQPLTAAIAAAAPGAVDLGGRTSLTDAVDLLALARVVVSNDSGLMHVAGALGRRVVGLYGSSSPAFTPPLAEAAVVLAEELPCRPCFARECPLGHLHCLENLSPERVVAVL